MSKVSEIKEALALVRQGKSYNDKSPVMTEEIFRDIIIMLETGATYQLACEAAGFPYKTLKKWIDDVEEKEEESEWYHIVVVIRKARPRLAFKALKIIENASYTDWKAAAWQLTHLFPRDIGPRKAVEVSGPEGGPIESHVIGKAQAELDRRLSELPDEILEKIIDDEK